MGETRGPVRHRRAPRRSGGRVVDRAAGTTPPASGDLQAVFTTLARRAKLPTRPDATPAAVLRAAGLPLLLATVVTGTQTLPAKAAVTPGPAAPGPAAPGPAAPRYAMDAWTVTSLTTSGRRPASQDDPVSAPGAVAIPTTTPAGRPARLTPGSTYTVRPGDTVFDIARRFGRSPADIITLNKLSPNGLVHPGEVLALPPVPGVAGAERTAPAEPAAPATRPYVVRRGDTLIDIAARHHVDLHTVLALNHLRVGSPIRPGQRLLLPAPAKTANSNDTFLGRTYPPEVVAAANANRRALARRSVPAREQAKAMIITSARKHGVDPALVLAIGYQESGFNQRMVSPANAVGVMQVIPSAGKWASDLIGQPLDLLDTRDNITAGVVLLATLSKAADSEAQAIAGYYQGLASVRSKGMFDDTRRYVANIRTLKSRFAKTL